MSAYRKSATMPLAIVEPVDLPPRGLVRANGSNCRCRPPGRIWCWWFKVQENDQWWCKHGGGWKRRLNHNIPFSPGFWLATESWLTKGDGQ